MKLAVKEQVDLKSHHTFGLSVRARFWIEIESLEGLKNALQWHTQVHPDLPSLILGGGSNILFTEDFPGVIFWINLQGKTVREEAEKSVYLKVAAGESWPKLVDWTVQQNWWGLENLSLIPGSVGAAPIQNIGAYGVELKDTLVELTALNRDRLELKTFTRSECQLGYRDSIFKQNPGQWIIIDVTFELHKFPHPHLDYYALQNYLADQKISEPDQRQIADAVSSIRRQKLPDPQTLGSAGSFFKNPIISQIQLQKLQSDHGAIKHFPVDEHRVKVPAAWLIQSCGWKGYRDGDAGVHQDQSLVLVNYGEASGSQLQSFIFDGEFFR